eukprot:jgi/Tetstr1/439062/TSEL_027552.t1
MLLRPPLPGTMSSTLCPGVLWPQPLVRGPPPRSRPPSSRCSSSTAESPSEQEQQCEENLFGLYCSIDAAGRHARLSLGEKEHALLGALTAHSAGRPVMSDAEYDLLKEDLEWQGSLLAALPPQERLVLAAERAYDSIPNASQRAIMSDGEYDAARQAMRRRDVAFAPRGLLARGPRCSLRSRRVFADVGAHAALPSFLTLPMLLGLAAGLAAAGGAGGAQLPTPGIAAASLAAAALCLPLARRMAAALAAAALGYSARYDADCPHCGQPTGVAVPRQTEADTSFRIICDRCLGGLRYDAAAHQITAVPPGE